MSISGISTPAAAKLCSNTLSRSVISRKNSAPSSCGTRSGRWAANSARRRGPATPTAVPGDSSERDFTRASRDTRTSRASMRGRTATAVNSPLTMDAIPLSPTSAMSISWARSEANGSSASNSPTKSTSIPTSRSWRSTRRVSRAISGCVANLAVTWSRPLPASS